MIWHRCQIILENGFYPLECFGRSREDHHLQKDQYQRSSSR